MNFQVNLENMSTGITGYSEIINQIDLGLKEVQNVVKSLGDEAWSGFAQLAYEAKVTKWENEGQKFLADFKDVNDILIRNIPTIDADLKEGMALDI